ncbi:accessory gene regulator ArgB-like protein [Paenibacillus sp. MMS20-IR301]|uniref:accessory gene regulator ArgB-like protein n=1 Tax=Paenibacillus sp. MMS20-IR301 TaxID=2895946 RepID=UPI0037C4FC93
MVTNLNSLALKISIAIKRINPEETVSIEIMKYSLGIILNTLLTFIVSLSIGFILGNFFDTLIFYISLSLLRVFSGGIHLKTAAACNIVTILICCMTPYLFQLSDNQLLYGTILCIILMLLFAPNPDKNTQIPKKWYPLLKSISLILVGLNFFIGSSVIGLAFLVQSVTIIPWKRRC